MITRLEQLTVSQFVELASGNMDILLEKKEKVPEIKLVETARAIMMEYRVISDKSGFNGYLSREESLTKAKLEKILFTMCLNLANLNAYDNVRDVLTEYGINVSKMTDRHLLAEIKSRLARAKSTIAKKSETEPKEAGTKGIRESFDEQTAGLMAHFKFQIDPATMKASLYAHLVARCNREIKAMATASKKKN